MYIYACFVLNGRTSMDGGRVAGVCDFAFF